MVSYTSPLEKDKSGGVGGWMGCGNEQRLGGGGGREGGRKWRKKMKKNTIETRRKGTGEVSSDKVTDRAQAGEGWDLTHMTERSKKIYSMCIHVYIGR